MTGRLVTSSWWLPEDSRWLQETGVAWGEVGGGGMLLRLEMVCVLPAHGIRLKARTDSPSIPIFIFLYSSHLLWNTLGYLLTE